MNLIRTFRRDRRALSAATVAITALAGLLLGALGTPDAAHGYQCGNGEVEPEPPPHDPRTPKPNRPDDRRPLIVSMGDSYASGEGAPDVAAPDVFTPARWQDRACHRSANAPVTRAVERLRFRNPYAQGIDTINVACSGATVAGRLAGGHDTVALDGGLLDQQVHSGRPAQVDQVDAAVGTGTIDALGHPVQFIRNTSATGTGRYGRGTTELPATTISSPLPSSPGT
jgi:hypothetical protein